MEFLPQVLWEGVLTGLIIAMIAMGVSLTWGVMYVVNFAQSELLMISMFMAYLFTTYSGLDPLLCIPIVGVLMYFFGVLLYKLFIKKVLKAAMLSQLLLTYSLSLALVNISLIIFGGQYKTVTTQHFTKIYQVGSLTIAMNKVVPLVICIISSIVLYIILNKTRLGRSIKATALNKTAAGLIGVDAEKAYTRCVGISSATAGVAGVALSYYFYVYPSVGSVFMNFAFVACCIGGMGSIPGAVLGGVIMGLIDSIIGTYFNVALKYLAMFLLYIIIVFKRPKGFFGW